MNHQTDGTENFNFKFTKVTHNHFQHRAAVDDHNNKQCDSGNGYGMSLEKAQSMHRWVIKCFSFILAACEINAYLAYYYFKNLEIEVLDFRRGLVNMLLNNNFDEQLVTERLNGRPLRSNAVCELINRPLHKKIIAGNWVRCFKKLC